MRLLLYKSSHIVVSKIQLGIRLWDFTGTLWGSIVSYDLENDFLRDHILYIMVVPDVQKEDYTKFGIRYLH